MVLYITLAVVASLAVFFYARQWRTNQKWTVQRLLMEPIRIEQVGPTSWQVFDLTFKATKPWDALIAALHHRWPREAGSMFFAVDEVRGVLRYHRPSPSTVFTKKIVVTYLEEE